MWETRIIGSSKTQFRDGDRSKRYPSRSEFVNDGPIFLNAESIKSGKINLQFVNHITLEKFNSITKGRIRKNDILITTRGNGIGDVAYVDMDLLGLINAQMLILRTSIDELYPLYTYYYFRTGFCKEQIGIFSSGSAQPQIPIKDLKHLPIVVPPLPIQRKIAAILSAYDELIENNNRRIAILEKMAEEIYREWFVRLRFSGHENVKIVKGVPEGWEVRKIGEIYKTSSGGTPLRDNSRYYNGEINWFKTGELKSAHVFDSEEKITNEGLENSSAKLYPINTIVIAMYCAMQNISILANEATTNQACCSFLSLNESVPHLFTYYQIKYALPHMIAFSHGAAQQNLSQEIIKTYSVFLPPVELITKFSELVNRPHETIKLLMLRNRILKSTRDLLLPRLISGMLDVENLDIAFPPGMKEEPEEVHA